MPNTISASSTIADFVRPGPFLTDVKEYVSKRDGAKDTLEGVINVTDWLKYLYGNEYAGKVSAGLEPVKQSLAVPGFIEALGNMRDKWHIYHHSDAPEAGADLVASGAVASLNLCESAMAVNSWGIYPLKEGLKAAKTGFWVSAGMLDAISFFRELGKANSLNKKMENLQYPELKNIQSHKIQLCYLNVAKAVTTLVMASIALISLLFASLAHGFLFSPVVFMTLGSAWLILTYVTHFYGKMIERWEKDLPAGVR